IKLLVVGASQRPNSLSARVAEAVKAMVEDQQLAGPEDVRMVELSDYREALWDDDPAPAAIEARNVLREAAAWCDAVVYVVPEWSGMAPPLAKNFFLHMDGMQLAHKPGLLVAVSSGTGGAYPIFELRGSSYKNTKICWIPEHVILRAGTLEALESGEFAGQKIAQRLMTKLQILFHYARALNPQREALRALSKAYPYGM
ncbi:NAD(P)H-dependent oxidoreductase, partial [Allosphingosinicella sp.]|uniref:NAD(P)H-dependent oxidoreductase n=1 Tax=Allosphingosinicella sp. TaxID=2823234 RepID=UPI002F1E7C74